jgi:hypothetical protein
MAALLVAWGVAACAPSIAYLGETHPPTLHAEVWYGRDRVPPDAIEIGAAEARASIGASVDGLVESLRQEAMARGAHAVLIEGMDVRVIGESTSYSEHGWVEPRDRRRGERGPRYHTTHGSASTRVIRERLISATFYRLPDGAGPPAGADAGPPPAAPVDRPGPRE